MYLYFVNPTDELVELISKTEYKNTTWYNAICKGDDKELGKIWSKNEGGSFLMSNYSIAKRLLPNTMNDWLLYNEATPFNLSGINNAGSLSQVDNSVGGAVKVERAMARFDFRDGSRSLPENIRPQEGNTYPVVQDIAPDGTPGAYIVNVQLGKMALVNMNNSFIICVGYLIMDFRHKLVFAARKSPGLPLREVGKLILLVIMSWMCGQPRRIKALRQQD